jgi:hypothetical protein
MQAIYLQKVKKLEDKLTQLTQKYETYQNRKNLEIEGFKKE